MKCTFKHHDLQMVGLKLYTNLSDSHQLEVVGRSSETQCLEINPVCLASLHLTGH